MVSSTVNGRKVIHLSFFCERHLDGLVAAGLSTELVERWRTVPIHVSDGGACYFHLDVDPRTGEVHAFSVNGDA